MELGNIIESLQDMGGLEIIGAVVILLFLYRTPEMIKFFRKKNKNGSSEYNNLDIKYIIDKSIQRAIKIFDIREYKTIQEQMNLVDRCSINCKANLLEAYKSVDDNNRDFRAYDKILEYTLQLVRNILKEWIRTNHLLERTEKEFIQYVRDTRKTIMQEHIALLDKEYNSEDFTITRKELRQANESIWPVLEDIIEKCLFDIREITREKAKEIKALEVENIFE